MIVELNIKDLGLQEAIRVALNASDVCVLVSSAYGDLPFRADWRVSGKQLKGIADVVALVDGCKKFFSWI